MSTRSDTESRDPRAFTDTLYIDGQAVRGQGDAITVINPGTEDVLARVPGASEAQVIAAVTAARRAFDTGIWSDLPPAERAATLRRLMDYLFSWHDRLIDLAVREAGCPIRSPTMFAQVDAPLQHGRDIIDLYLQLPAFEENPLPLAERISWRGGAVQSLRRYAATGVVAAISAYNFPFFTNLWKVLPALVTGNTVVLRPSPFTPLSALIFGEAAAAAGLPAGVLNVVAEAGTAGGILLSTHTGVDMVAFTGSTSVGKQVAIQAINTMKRLQLELGGKSAQIYLPDSMKEAALAAAQVCFAHAGQGCALGTRIFVPEAEKAAAITAMVAALNGARIGDPGDPATMLGPVISAAQRDRCQRFVDLAVAAGAKIAHGGKRPNSPERGFFFEPTILDMPDNTNPAAQEEIFGPVVGVIGYRDLDHAIAMANDSPYGLSGYVHGKDTRQAVAVASQLRTGTVHINGGLLSAYASSGGWRSSGVGRERGVEGIRIYQQLQALNIQGT